MSFFKYCKDTLNLIIFAIKTSFSFVKSQILLEKPNIRYWMIITFAIGILTGFLTDNSSKILLVILSIFSCSLLILVSKKHKKIILKFVFFFITGLIISSIKVHSTEQIRGNFGAREAVIEGKIDEVRLTNDVSYLTLTMLKAPNTELINRKIKLKYNNTEPSLSVGDVVKVKTSISVVKYNVFPNDKSYENYAKYFNIVARGKIKELQIIRDTNKSNFFDKIRKKIQTRIFEVNNHSAGAGVVIDILTGNNSFIPRDKLNNIRRSGCAHILAISGLHMSIIVAFVFIVFSHIFSLFPKIALKYNTKKLALLPAFITCFIYLQISSIPVSALRSFIMISIGFMTLLANRAKSSMNVLFITFFIILCIEPHYILSPSFQMSFMAVFCLISAYHSEFLTQSNTLSIKNKSIRYVVGILSSSIIATIATMFFEIYHFKQFSWIGLLSNISVIPLTEFVVLPIGFIGMLFNGTFLGDFFYQISSYFAENIITITDFTANLPNAFLLTPQMQLWQLGLIVFSIITLFLSKSFFLKTLGFILSVVGIIYYIIQPKILLVYNQNLKNIVFFENGKYYSVNKMNDYTKSVWTQNLGINDIAVMTDKNKNIKCNTNQQQNIINCTYFYQNRYYTIKKKLSSKSVSVYLFNGKFLSNH